MSEEGARDLTGFRAVVRGHVQMVGYRFFTVRAAEERGVRGWVGNRRDGSVEVEAVGSRPALETFLEDLRKGPPSAQVSAVDLEWLPEPRTYRGFSVEHSL